MPNADRLVDDSAVKPDVDEVRVLLTQDALTLKGWKSVRITRSVEVATSEFQMTCSADANTLKLLGKEGAPVTVSIGDSLVLTGFVETIETYLTPRMHEISISGRGKLGDLVDCSCRIDRVNANTNLTQLCTVIASSYSISVVVPDSATQTALAAQLPLPRQIISITETAWEVIERYARYCGVLVYESEKGELVISQAGEETGASGVALGQNVEAIVCTKSTLGTFSTYNAVLSAYSAGTDDEDIPNIPVVTVVNTGVAANAARIRPTFFVSEQSATDRDFITKRVNWMASRAYGRARRVRVLADNWRDGSGAVWRTNVSYPVSAAVVGVPDNTMLLLAEVTFILNENGTHAELVFGPRQGFLPEPIALDVLPMDESTQSPSEQ
ncbi:phage baseplate assembly protein [Paraburkholderia sp.]|uniref:phage baseplate assembly protein n=1 Tax=Paraburkholderia sp. TaxID=1926495 RepID=UPI00286FA193|nr:hypothetical protein [Paraburkholderia sp.]